MVIMDNWSYEWQGRHREPDSYQLQKDHVIMGNFCISNGNIEFVSKEVIY